MACVLNTTKRISEGLEDRIKMVIAGVTNKKETRELERWRRKLEQLLRNINNTNRKIQRRTKGFPYHKIQIGLDQAEDGRIVEIPEEIMQEARKDIRGDENAPD